MCICCVFDNTQKTFVGSLPDNNSLFNCLIPAKGFGWLHGLIFAAVLVKLKCRVHCCQIWTSRRGSTNSSSLGGDSVDHASLGDKDTGILVRVVGVQEDI
jgi:hypothetical protein